MNDPTPLDGWPPDDPTVRALRTALLREGDAVTPARDGLHRIRAELRVRERARGGRRRLVLSAAAVAGVVVIGGVSAVEALLNPSSGGRHGPASSGALSPTPGPSTSVAGSSVPGLPVYYPGRTGTSYGLFREFHPVGPAGPLSIAQRVQAAVSQAMARPPDDPDYTLAWATGAGARVSLSADVITIRLNQAAAGGTTIAGSAADAAAIQQLIWTATAAAASGAGSPAATPGSTAASPSSTASGSGSTAAVPSWVRIVADGPTPERFGSISLTQAFQRGSHPGGRDPRAPVWIDSLAQDAAVPAGSLEVRGQALGGPAGLRWSLVQAGRTVESGTVRPTTTAGAVAGVGVRGTWTVHLTALSGGRYTFSVTADPPPGGAEGGSDSKDFTTGG